MSRRNLLKPRSLSSKKAHIGQSSKKGTYKTVTARIRRWLSNQGPSNVDSSLKNLNPKTESRTLPPGLSHTMSRRNLLKPRPLSSDLILRCGSLPMAPTSPSKPMAPQSSTRREAMAPRSPLKPTASMSAEAGPARTSPHVSHDSLPMALTSPHKPMTPTSEDVAKAPMSSARREAMAPTSAEAGPSRTSTSSASHVNPKQQPLYPYTLNPKA
jgi:hypothetical protein